MALRMNPFGYRTYGNNRKLIRKPVQEPEGDSLSLASAEEIWSRII
jgi:hypothetical protein